MVESDTAKHTFRTRSSHSLDGVGDNIPLGRAHTDKMPSGAGHRCKHSYQAIAESNCNWCDRKANLFYSIRQVSQELRQWPLSPVESMRPGSMAKRCTLILGVQSQRPTSKLPTRKTQYQSRNQVRTGTEVKLNIVC